MDVTPQDDMIADARSSLEEGLGVRILIGGAWLKITELIRYKEVGLVRAEQSDGTMILFPDNQLAAVAVKGH